MTQQKTRTFGRPTHDEVAAIAFLIWQKEGQPAGQQVRHWLEAEAQLKADHEHELREKRPRRNWPAP
jgi:hypothetical protein